MKTRGLTHGPRRPTGLRADLEQLEDRAVPAVITVTTTADDIVPNDGSVSLREAIEAINASSNLGDPDIIAESPGAFGVNDTINFSIPQPPGGPVVQTINVGGTGNGALPALSKPMTINGYSETGASANTLANGDNARILIELNGASAGAGADGLLVSVTGAGSTIKGLAINRFSLNGIELQGGGNVVAGNFVGTNPAGTAAEPNQVDGIRVSSSSGSTIGGTTPAARNVVSGNQFDGIHIVGSLAAPATGNLVQGNFVGTNAAGTGSVGIKTGGGEAGTPAGNFLFGIAISGGTANTVGGATAAARNVVGLNAAGIEIDNGGENNVVQGNFSGVGADGVTPVGNNLDGIVLRSDDNLAPPLGPGQANEPGVSGNMIGLNPTAFTGLGNLVEFNGTGGIAVFGNPLPNNATPAQNSGNSILGNSVFENGRDFQTASSAPTPLLGIDLTKQFLYPREDGLTADDSRGHGAANDPNNFQNFPVLTSVTQANGYRITGTLAQSGSPNVTYRIEFFVNNPDPLGLPAEGQTFIGAVNATADAAGTVSFSPTFNVVLKPGQLLTATATNLTADPSSPPGSANLFNTSEFSAAFPVPQLAPVLAASGLPNGTAALFAPNAAGQYSTPTATLSPFGNTGTSVRTAVADVNGDGIPDTILVTGPGTPIRVAVVSGGDNTTVLVQPFDPFGGNFIGGGFVAAGDFDASGRAEFVVTPDQGGGPRVSIFALTPTGLTTKANFFGIADPNFRGGARAAVGDVNGDGTPDLVVAAGFGGGPRVAVFNGTTLFTTPTRLINDFFAFPGTDATNLRNGTFVAVGDVNGDGSADLIFGGGPGGAPRVFILSGALVAAGNVAGAQATPIANFFVANNSTDRGGVRVAAKNADGDNRADVAVGSGQADPARVRVYLGKNFTGTGEPTTFPDLAAFGGVPLADGVYVG